MDFRLTKEERLSSKQVIDRLFSGGSGSMAVYPLRVVWMVTTRQPDDQTPPVRMLVSVPKKRFHHAVDRNRLKRQVREAFRLNKHILWQALADTDKRVDIGFISITDTPVQSHAVRRSVVKALIRISEKL